MTYSFSAPLRKTLSAYDAFTVETTESLCQVSWAVILARYAGSDTVVLEQVSRLHTRAVPQSRHLDVTSSQTLGSVLKQLKRFSTSAPPRTNQPNHGILRSNIHAAGGCIGDDASHILLVVKDSSTGTANGWYNSNQQDNKLITCTVTVRSVGHTEPSQAVNLHVEATTSLPGNHHHLQHICEQFENVLNTVIRHVQSKKDSARETTLRECFEISHNEIEKIFNWNQVNYPPTQRPTCIHHLIQQKSIQQPDAPAICAWDGELSYAQLWDESSKLAQRLTRHGVGLDILVPFCFEKSAWAIVAMLGILQAGGAFVPLDQSWPRSRLEQIIGKAKANLVVTSPLTASICTGLVENVLVLDSHSKEANGHTKLSPLVNVGHHNLAYVLFTSGSTGQPKGALIEHGQISTSAIAIGTNAQMGRNTRFFQFASYGFDASLIEIFCTLVLGGCVCVPPDSERLDDPVHAIQRMNVNTLFFTPSFLSTMDPKAFAQSTSIHTVMTGGENVPVHLMETWSRDFLFLNAYGPTECAISTVMSNVTASTPAQGRIGRAISGKTWIVDQDQDGVLVPIGAVGELLVQGPAVGRGYLDDPRKTAAVFADTSCFSWAQEALEMNLTNGNKKHKTPRHERIYRTGDLVRYNSAGDIFYVGRKDTQVKLRGQRIELGEIEFHLRQYMASPLQVIAEMITKKGPDGDTQMIAALIWSTGDSSAEADGNGTATSNGIHQHISLKHIEPFLAELDQRLKKSLPRYMVPSIYIPVPNIPLTTSGKLDRRKIREFAESSKAKPFKITKARSSATRHAKMTRMESELRQLWAKFINISEAETISLDDNFFHLGGNSLIAIKMVAAARNQGISLRIQDIFKSPTLSKMAAKATRVNKPSQNTSGTDLKPFSLVGETTQKEQLMTLAVRQCNIPAHQVQDILPCTPAQTFYMDSATYFTDSKPSGRIGLSDHFIYHVRADVVLPKLREAWNRVALTNEILRTRIILDTDTMYQVVVREQEIEPLAWSILDKANLEDYLAKDKKHDFGYGDRLCRFALVTSKIPNAPGEETTTHFVLSMQHAICDAWMMRLLFDEVERVYNDLSDSQTSPCLLHEDTAHHNAIKFNTFLKHMTETNTNTSSEAAHFWRSHLHGSICKPFPCPPPQPQNKSSIPPSNYSLNTIQTHTIHLPLPKSSSSPTTTTTNSGITPSTTLYGALALLLGVSTHAPDVIFHLTRSGRDIHLPGVEGMIAPALTRHPLRVNIDRGDTSTTVGDLLHTIQDDLANMAEYQFTGWGAMRGMIGGGEKDVKDVNGVLGCRSSYLVNVVTQDGDGDDTGAGDGGRPRLLELESEATFTPMPAGFYTSFVISADGSRVEATVRYDGRVLKRADVEGLMRRLEGLLVRMMGLGGQVPVCGGDQAVGGEGGLGESLEGVKRWIVGAVGAGSGPDGLGLPDEDQLYC